MEKEAKEIWEQGMKLNEMVKTATNKNIALVLVLSVPRDDEDRKSDINNCMGSTIGDPMHLGHIMNNFFKQGDLAKFMVVADIIKDKLAAAEVEEAVKDAANEVPV